MTPPASRLPSLRAAIYADSVGEIEACAHENIADEIDLLVKASLSHWRTIPGMSALPQPDSALLFAGLADVLSDTLPRISSGHLQAIEAAR